ncbi:MAG: hypothetical protein COA78_27690 [Blastopirellula sp.]|nr:MAG: hypothetical protein COA78_27690 [Blastopirellula sp.]
MFSWNFTIQGQGQHASLEFNWLNEQGSINIDGHDLSVVKHGMLSGFWTLEHAGETILAAQKPNAFSRSFEIQQSQATWLFEAKSAFGRSFNLKDQQHTLATMRPKHIFTRSFTVETYAEQIPFATIVFCSWLMILTWRRQANNSN